MVLTAYGEKKDFLCSMKWIQDAHNLVSREGYLVSKGERKKGERGLRKNPIKTGNLGALL